MPTCRECNDTGVIDTGNNDLPCSCPAGDTAKFNVAGIGLVTGKTVRAWQSPIRRASERYLAISECLTICDSIIEAPTVRDGGPAKELRIRDAIAELLRRQT